MPDDQPETRLSRYMNARRLDLGLRWEEVAEAAGLSESGLRRLRHSPSVPRELTQRGIEKALCWRTGSVLKVIRGGEPDSADPASPFSPRQQAILEAFAEVAGVVEAARRKVS